MYSFDALLTAIPAALESVPLEVIRRYARRCDRHMDAYREKEAGVRLTVAQVKRAMKHFKSHRSIPRSLGALFPELPRSSIASATTSGNDGAADGAAAVDDDGSDHALAAMLY